MFWRKWLVRLLVFSIVACVTAAAAVYRHYTNPTAVREQVIARLQEHLPGARVQVESASLKLMGGITFQDLHLSRKDDPGDATFLSVPNGTIFHDKEQLLDGKVVIRKIEFDKPWLRVVREKNGSWNLNGILGAVDLSKLIPTIVLKQATVYVEDRKADPPVPPIEIKDVNLSIMNDSKVLNPRETLEFSGSGVCALIGTIEISGRLGRASDQFSLSLHMPDVPVGGNLVQRLATYRPEAADHLRQLTGKIKNLNVDLLFDPQTNPQWSYGLRGHLADGRFGHARLPMTLEQVEGDISMIDGRLSLKKITAHFGETRFELGGEMAPGKDGYDIERGVLVVSRLVIDEALLQQMPEQIQSLNEMFRPRGPISFLIEADRHAGKWKTRSHFEPEEMRAACQKFPYELERIRGTVEQESESESDLNVVKIDLIGFSGKHAVTVRGKMGEKGKDSVAVHVRARDLPLDDKIRSALQKPQQAIVDSFQPKGLVDVDVDVIRQHKHDGFQNRIIAQFHDCTIRYALFPYPIENVRGVLDILPDHWEFHDFVGRNREGSFQARGGSFPIADGAGHQLRIELAGDRIRLDEQMARALKQPALQQTWSALNPAGHLGFTAEVLQLPKPGQPNVELPPDITVHVTPEDGCQIRPTVFPFAMEVSLERDGSVEYHDRQVTLKQIVFRHQPTVLKLLEGKVTCKENGGLSIDLGELVGNPVVPDGELVAALPGTLGTAVKVMELREPLSLRLPQLTVDVRAEGETPEIYWDGSVGLDKAFVRLGVPFEQVSGKIFCKGNYKGQLGPVEGHVDLSQATLFRQPFERLKTNFNVNVVQPNIVVLNNLNARLFGGSVDGIVRINLDKGLIYELNLNATQVQLADFGAHNQIGTRTQLSGAASASLFLRGSGTDLASLQGNGSADVMNGKIYNLPPIISLLKVFNGRLPDDTAFEEAHLQFSISGRRMDLNRLDFFGAALTLGGRGSMQLDGSNLMVDLYALVGPFNNRLPLIGNLEAAISKQLLGIKMRGSLSDPKCIREPVPLVVEPIKGMMNFIRGRAGEASQ